MNDRALAQTDPAPLPSLSLALTCALHALPLSWLALVAPVRATSWLSLLLGALALLHVGVAVLALSKRPRALSLAWQILAVASLVVLLALTCTMASSALYLSVLYRGVGRAVAAALACLWLVFVLFTVPISAWAFSRTLRPRTLGVASALGAAVVLATSLSLAASRTAHAAPVSGVDETTLAALARTAEARTQSPHPQLSLFHTAPMACREPIDAARLTLLATTLRDGAPSGVCLQATTRAELAQRFASWLDAQPTRAPVVLDLVRGVQRIRQVHPLLDALMLRPGLDGVCRHGRCFAPFQLVGLNAFTSYHPLDAVGDASFGVSFSELSRALDVHDTSAPFLRIETDSALVDRGKSTPLVRMRARHVAVDSAALERAERLASAHILRAQRDDGGFRYLLEPFRGYSEPGVGNLPRQAGTTLALCELVPSDASREPVNRALVQLSRHERAAGKLSALSDNPERGSLGQSALPLVAFVSCRGLVGDQHDALIGRLTRLLLSMQRPNGSFHPELDLANGTPLGWHESLYSAGQAVLALVLVEQLAKSAPKAPLPERVELHSAVERAMTYYAKEYWPKPLRSLFYLEENWHCLAARAALNSHRHDAYERFCLDYVDFKARLILEGEHVTPEHRGGYGLSDMFPPHSTATAGYGEALAAAIAVRNARKLPLDEQRARLERVLGFLVRQQWTEDNCFACASDEVWGAFSESSASPIIRIDYVQHALAALGHGRRALALAKAR